jgi:hypothetical protein
MAKARVKVKKEVMGSGREWRLCFQMVEYHYNDARPMQTGYRFIYRHNGKLKPQRAQAYLPSVAAILDLLQQAAVAGWLGEAERPQLASVAVAGSGDRPIPPVGHS